MTNSQTAFTDRPFGSFALKTALLDPLLVVGVTAFWLLTLPLVAVALLAVKIWDTASAFAHRSAVQSNPLILRRGQVARAEYVAVHASVAKRA